VLNQYAPGDVGLLERKVRIYQQLNNVEYCLNLLPLADEDQIREAVAILEQQAHIGEA
jgi:hypothetical protein